MFLTRSKIQKQYTPVVNFNFVCLANKLEDGKLVNKVYIKKVPGGFTSERKEMNV